MSTNIQKMILADYDEVYQLWNETAGIGLRTLDDSEPGIKKFLIRNPETNFICRVDNRLCGVILCGHDGRRAYIYHTAVHKDFRNQGIGHRLVKSVLRSLENEGIKKVALVVYKENTSGNSFWESIDFTERDDLNYRNRTIDEFNI